MKACCSQNTNSGGETRFDKMIQNCYDYAVQEKEKGRRIVGIMCEYTPRELFLAADAVPVCLCGGSEEKISPAEKDLPAGLCPLIKSTYGYHATQTNPFVEMADLIVAETTCDGKKKMYELMSRTRPMYVLELPQKPDDPDARKHWHRELTKLRGYLETTWNVKITDEKLRKAIRRMNRERSLRKQLAEQMKSETPPWTGRRLLDFKAIISGIEEDLCAYEKILEQADSAAAPKTEQIRVLLTGVPTVHGAEKVVNLIEETGGLIVCMENCTGIKPVYENISEDHPDPLAAIADKYFALPCSVMTSNQARIDLLTDLIQQYRPDCVIDLVWQGCLTYDVESYWVQQLAREQKLPYLKIQTDYSASDSARIRLRIEALLETIREKR